MAIEGFEDIEAQNSQESSVVRSFVAAEPVSDVKKNVAAIRRPFVASENRDKGSCQFSVVSCQIVRSVGTCVRR